jgi:Tol biopolymer transport system component
MTEGLKPGGEAERLTYDGEKKRGLTWSVDGKDIIFSSGVSNPKLYRISSAGGQPLPVALFEAGLINPVIHRKTGKLTFAQIKESGNQSDIWRVGLDDAHLPANPPTRFICSTRNDRLPRFSPNGEWIAFLSDRTGSTALWICDAEGSNAIQLTEVDQWNWHNWSPDGEQIAFMDQLDGNIDLWVINSSGRGRRRLTRHPAPDFHPSWSNDGKWVYFQSSRGGSNRIWKISTVGGKAAQLSTFAAHMPQESPDGNWLYYKTEESLWRLALRDAASPEDLGLKIGGAYTVGNDGIYYAAVPEEGKFALKFRRMATGTDNLIAVSDKPFGWGLTVSPDSHTVLYSLYDDQWTLDLMLVENFR